MISFFLTVDSEGINYWNKPSEVTRRNTKGLYRTRLLCEKYNIKLIYVTNYVLEINNTNLLKSLISKFFQYGVSISRSKLNNLNELKKIVHWNVEQNIDSDTFKEYLYNQENL